MNEKTVRLAGQISTKTMVPLIGSAEEIKYCKRTLMFIHPDERGTHLFGWTDPNKTNITLFGSTKPRIHKIFPYLVLSSHAKHGVHNTKFAQIGVCTTKVNPI